MQFQNGSASGSISRRSFCATGIATMASLAAPKFLAAEDALNFDLAAFERPRVLSAARKYLSQKPITITASSSPRSTGGKHDYFSEGDYWWPDQGIRMDHTSSATACRIPTTSLRIAMR